MGLGKAAQRAGAYLFENAAVKGLEKSRGGFRLDTARGALQAREVIVATSGYTGAATPVFQQRIVPIGSYIIATETLPSELAEPLSPQRRMMFDSKNYLFYFRLTADRRMLFGGRASFVPETPASVRRSAELLQKGMTWVYPQLAQVSIQYVWGGNLDFALDWLPHAGSLDGVHYALGYAGHGVALATLLGTRLGEKLAGGEDHNPFKDLYFPRLPAGLHAVIPPLMPLAGWWFRFLDWVS
jgi:glycine/D-amino acid oxidase-like deaminating enzyme